MEQTQTSSGVIVGYFEHKTDAQRAVEALQDAGFTSAHVGVAHRETAGAYSSDGATPTSGSGRKEEGMWGKMKNFFGGDAEPYADERTRGELANREITPNPADNYAGADTYSGYDQDFHENLSSMSVPQDRSRYFSHRFTSGQDGAVVTVNAGDRNGEAEQILRRFGADLGENAANYDYSQTSGTGYSQNDTGYAQNNTTATTGTGYAQTASSDYAQNSNAADQGRDNQQLEGTRNIQLLGELLRVHKDRVNRGEVRLRKEVITETQTVQVPVTREELVIERRAVSGETPASGTIGNSEEIRIPLTEETASVDKATVVREEVAVGKKAVGQVRDLTGEVRHEELVVDDPTTRKVANG